MKKTMILALAMLFSAFLYAQEAKKSEIKVSDLPKGIGEWVKTNIPGGKITRAGKIEENGVTKYVASVESQGRSHGYTFDKDGKFLGKAERPQGMQKKGGPAAPPAPAKPAATEEGAPKK